MSFRTKRGITVFGPSRALGGSDPSMFSDLIGYWDARDLSAGAMTTWPMRAGTLGNLAGTGTVATSSGVSYIMQPRLISTNPVATSGAITSSTPKSFFLVGKAYIIGADNRALSLINISAPADTAANRSGMWWYNYSGNVLKIQGTSTDTAAGISQLSINTRYLLIVNHTSATSGIAYTWAQTGASTTVSAQTWNNTTAKLCVGTTPSANANEGLDGDITACGAYAKILSTDEINGLRDWATREFGVVG